MKTHLFIVAHVDDPELSCGGLISKLVASGDFVHVISFTNTYDEINLYSEFEESMKTLGVQFYQAYSYQTRNLNQFRKDIADLSKNWCDGIDFVYTHSCEDRHPDHRTVAEEVKRVCNVSLFTFLCPWNGEENSNYFVEISEQQIETKLKALACYKSQSHRRYTNPGFTVAQANYNGIKCGKLYAEAFKIERLIA